MLNDAEVRARATEALLEDRALRPRGAASTNEGITPNDNLPAAVPPGTVGADGYTPGDPDGFEIIDEGAGPPFPRSVIRASPWSGWPEDWATPFMSGAGAELVDTAWHCTDLNASVLSTMPAYGVRGRRVDQLEVVDLPFWIENPNPDLYASWEEFLYQLFWDFQHGEAFVLATSRYSDGYPARFHVVAPWLVNVEMVRGVREYRIGSIDVTDDMLHIRYKSRTDDARGHGPLEAAGLRVTAARALASYATNTLRAGGIPSYVIKHPRQLTAKQSNALLAQWWESRMSTIGLPAVLSGGVELEQMQFSPRDMALVELEQYNASRLAVLLGVPPFLAGLPSGGDSMTYSNVSSLFDYHWRAGLRTKASRVMPALSQWLLPLGTRIELDRDEYVRPALAERAQAYSVLHNITDDTGRVLTAAQIRVLERMPGQPGAAPPPPTPVGLPMAEAVG